MTKDNVTVTIRANEEIQEVAGWTLSSDKKILTKEYSENTRETITIKDLAGNETQVAIEVDNIEKESEIITGGNNNNNNDNNKPGNSTTNTNQMGTTSNMNQSTTSNKILPHTGLESILMIAIGLVMIAAGVFYIKYKRTA